jgi:hypothetical protein
MSPQDIRVVTDFVHAIHVAVQPHLGDTISWADVVSRLTSVVSVAGESNRVEKVQQLLRQN